MIAGTLALLSAPIDLRVERVARRIPRCRRRVDHFIMVKPLCLQPGSHELQFTLDQVLDPVNVRKQLAGMLYLAVHD